MDSELMIVPAYAYAYAYAYTPLSLPYPYPTPSPYPYPTLALISFLVSPILNSRIDALLMQILTIHE